MSISVKIRKKLGSFRLNMEFDSEGGVMGLLGASGCGKSVTLRCIAGILKPESGSIVLNGRTLFDSEKKIDLPPQQRRVGYLFQNYALFPNMTVWQNIACGAHAEKNSVKRKKAVADMITAMRLDGLERQKPHQLSGGQQQRTALARILVGQPEILLLDEPFSALDTYLRDQLLNELTRILGGYGKDTLMVTHSRDEAYKLCGRLAIIDGGELKGIGDTAALFSDPGTRTGALLTGCKNIVDAEKAGDTLVHVPEWGITLDAGQGVKDGLKAIGIRAHMFDHAEQNNAYNVEIVEMSEEPFEWTVKFVYNGQTGSPIWWRLSKKDMPEAMPDKLGIKPESVLLLYS